MKGKESHGQESEQMGLLQDIEAYAVRARTQINHVLQDARERMAKLEAEG
jgi:hypothetical protein